MNSPQSLFGLLPNGLLHSDIILYNFGPVALHCTGHSGADGSRCCQKSLLKKEKAKGLVDITGLRGVSGKY